MLRVLILILFVITGVISGAAQENRNSQSGSQQADNVLPPQKGTLNIHQDESLDEMLERYKNINLENNNMPGYRIQIFFGSGRKARDKAYEAKALFISDFPLIPAYVLYEAPYFKVRVGDYRTKREATSLFNRLHRKFPDAYITPLSKINLPPLKSNS